MVYCYYAEVAFFFQLHKRHALFHFECYVFKIFNELLMNFYELLILSQGSTMKKVNNQCNFYIMLWTRWSTVTYKILCIWLWREQYFSQKILGKFSLLDHYTEVSTLKGFSIPLPVSPACFQQSLSFLGKAKGFSSCSSLCTFAGFLWKVGQS